MENPDRISPVQGKGRLLSLDALRGFDMLWIIGGDFFLISLAKWSDVGWLKTLAEQMNHVKWIGFHFYDLIFPLFMFISGIAITLSVKSRLILKTSKSELVKKALYRMVILVSLGILYNGAFRDGFANARYVSILGQIGIAYFFASLIIIFSRSFKTSLFWLSGILIGIVFIQLFVPVPGIGAGVLTPEGHINGYVDRLLLPGRLAYGNGTFDALGIISTISAIAITLMGTGAGYILQLGKLTEYQKAGILVGTGFSLLVFGLFASPFYPVIKQCWTTTYSLIAGGISFLLIALFYLIIDVWGYQKWSFFFRVIGMNSVFIYLFVRIAPVDNIMEFFIGWIIKAMGEDSGQVIKALGALTGEWLLLYYMYRKKIFIKV